MNRQFTPSGERAEPAPADAESGCDDDPSFVGVDAYGTIRFATNTIEKTFLWHPTELVGRPLRTLIPALTTSATDSRTPLPRCGPRQGTALAVRRKDGYEVSCTVSFLDVHATNREGICSAALIRHRSGTATLAYAELAHELNQPLTAALNYVTSALARVRDRGVEANSELAVALDRAALQVQRAAEIVGRTVRVGVSGDGANAATRVDDVVRDALALVADDLDRRQVRVRLELADGLPPVSCDAGPLEQVMVNLVRNALDALAATPSATRLLTVRAGLVAGEVVEVVVADTGCGVPVPLVDRMFEPFVTTKMAGMGMGLAICRAILEARGGRLWLAPTTSSGCAFHFTLPTSKG